MNNELDHFRLSVMRVKQINIELIYLLIDEPIFTLTLTCKNTYRIYKLCQILSPLP